MKKIMVVLISLAVTILVIGGYVFTHETSIPEPSLGPEWKFVATAPDGTTVYVNKKRITYLPKGVVKIWTLWVSKGELRREDVNVLKKRLLSEGKDPNNAKRLWYIISLYKFNCKNHQYTRLEDVTYSFGREVLDNESFQYEKWYYIPPGSIDERIEQFVCNETPLSIPEPSLSSDWKFVTRKSDETTLYVNTKEITHLPKSIVKVWTLWVPRGKLRRGLVSDLVKYFLSEGKDPNKAERVWYVISLEKFNCKKHQFALLEANYYSFEKAGLYSHSVQHEEWDDIIPGGTGEELEKLVCK